MPLPIEITIDPPSWRAVRRALRRRPTWAVVLGLLATLTLAGVTAVAHRQHPMPGGAWLLVRAQPSGASISLDGHRRGSTPARLAVAPGDHQLVLSAPQLSPEHLHVQVQAAQTSTVQARLWRATPSVRRVLPPLPGASITGTDFLADGRVVLDLLLSGDGTRQLWTLAAGSLPQRLPTPPGPGLLALSPDGASVAAAVAAAGTAQPQPPALRIFAVQDRSASRTIRLPVPAGDILGALSWSPDGRTLLAVTTPPGPWSAHATLVRVDSRSGAAPALLTLPSAVIPGSFVWSPTGEWVGLLAQAGETTTLCLLDVQTGQFRSLADLTAAAAAPTVAPLAWSADGRQAVYAAPAAGSSATTLGALLFGSGPRDTLFLLPSPVALPRALPGAAGAFPLWRNDNAIVALTQVRGAGGFGLRATTPAGGPAWDAGQVPLTGRPRGVRWDASHAEALVSTAAADGTTGSWLLSFAAEVTP